MRKFISYPDINFGQLEGVGIVLSKEESLESNFEIFRIILDRVSTYGGSLEPKVEYSTQILYSIIYAMNTLTDLGRKFKKDKFVRKVITFLNQRPDLFKEEIGIIKKTFWAD